MYRQPAPRDAEDKPPSELLYVARDREGRAKPGVAALQVFGLPAIVGALLSVLVTPTAGLVGLVATIVLGVWWVRRKPRTGLVLRVDDGELSVQARATQAVQARLRLDDLSDVVLETKTIQPLLDGPSAIPAMRFIDGRVGGDVDTARIALVDRDGTSIRLGDAYLAHMEAAEWFGKIRVFLRKHGWLPQDERAAPSSR